MPKDRVRIGRLIAEGLAIVVSILAAFAIDAWWDVFQERQRLDKVLAGLDAGLSESVIQIERNLAMVLEDGDRLRSFLTQSPRQAADIPFDSTYFTLQSIWRPNTEENHLTFLGTALEDPGLKSLEDVELARGMASWRVQVDEVEERGVQLALLEVEVLKALGRHPEVAQMLAGINLHAVAMGGVITEADRPGVSGEVMTRVREDREIVALGAAKSLEQQVHLLVLELLRQESESLRSLVRTARAR